MRDVPGLPLQLTKALTDSAAVERVIVSPQAGAQLPPALLLSLREALASSLAGAFMVGVALSALAIPVAVLIGGSARERPADAATALAPVTGDT